MTLWWKRLAALSLSLLVMATGCQGHDHGTNRTCSVDIQDLDRTWELTLTGGSVHTVNCSDPTFEGIPLGSGTVTTRFPDPQLKTSPDGQQIGFSFGYLGRLLYGTVDTRSCDITLSLESVLPGDPGSGAVYFLHCVGGESDSRLPLGGGDNGEPVFILSCGSLTFPVDPYADPLVTKADCELRDPIQLTLRFP